MTGTIDCFALFYLTVLFCCSNGYFIEPTIVESTDPKDKIMIEEIFGPVLSVYVYKDKDVQSTLDLVNNSTPYALTGAVFAKDQYVARKHD